MIQAKYLKMTFRTFRACGRHSSLEEQVNLGVECSKGIHVISSERCKGACLLLFVVFFGCILTYKLPFVCD